MPQANGAVPLIFVIETDRAVCDAAAMLLETLAWRVLPFESAVAALAALATETPDCILSCLGPDGADGIAVAEALGGRGSRIPVIVVTDLPDDDPMIGRAMAAGTRAILYQPYSERDLLLAITFALGEARHGPHVGSQSG
jgi:FixJ family two-component response regulator